ncbi:hypothetical protein ARHIZOSPH14_33810 [Agromyces rhizosphaerae]|uniref:Uncharacterized protein n=1 Tax=Agromyces rhizosphaerae TaxID=88374 RepID=A0A9W6D1J1_9MICO|nr:hypothetical protein [Agromyces rhizosphaerae]GLI29139.1 hypothetical protein ARHIZOSPH14_33810 [Agromyces rhizosphaerae]
MSWSQDAWNAAKTLLAVAGAVSAISSADVQKQAEGIVKNYSGVTVNQIRSKIQDDIKKQA